MLKTEFLLTTADEIRTFDTLSPLLEIYLAARGQDSRVTPGEMDCCELLSPREGNMGCDPEHFCELRPLLSPQALSNLALVCSKSSMQLNVLCCSANPKRSAVHVCVHACMSACMYVCMHV